MKTPGIPKSEPERLAALKALDLLDTPPEERFDRLTRLAQQLFGVETVLVSLIDADRQWFKSRQGMDVCETDRANSFCNYAILEDGIFEVADALADPRFVDNPLVVGPPHIRFYAGMSLSTADGSRVGTFCLVDSKPRRLSASERQALLDFSATVEDEINSFYEQKLRDLLAASESRNQAILDAMPDMVFVVDAAGCVLFCQAHAELPAAPEALLGCPPPKAMPPALAARYLESIALALTSDGPVTLEYESVRENAPVQFEARFSRLSNSEVLILVRDVSREKATANEVRGLLERLEKLTSNLPGMIYQYQRWPDGRSCFPYTSGNLPSLYGITGKGLDGDASPALKIVHPEDRFRLLEGIERSRQSQSVWQEDFRVEHPVDGTIWIEGRAVPERLDDGSTLWHGFLGNVTERKRLEQAQQEQAVQTRAILDNVVDGIVTSDPHGVIISVNPAVERMFGYDAAEVVGQNVSMLMPGLYRESSEVPHGVNPGVRLPQSPAVSREIEAVRKNGQTFSMDLAVSRISRQGQTLFIGIMRDISQRKNAEKEINNLAFYDPLTQLPNRRLFYDRLEHARSVSKRLQNYGALLFIDLDNFKRLNDAAGHHTGDRLLQLVAKRLSGCVGEDGTVARLGGDEFVVLLEMLGEDLETAAAHAEIVGEKIRTSLNEPYSQVYPNYEGTPSIGIALFCGNQTSAEEILKQADMAMYQAKAAGRNTLVFFDPQMQAAVVTRALMESELRLAIHEQQFELFYQPQVDADGQVTGAEALLRWHHPRKGLVRPNEFIPLAEETRLILPIGRWVLQTACGQLAAWASRPETEHLTLAINVSALQLAQPDFVEQVLTALDQAGANPSRAKLELTETLLASNIESVIAKMSALREQGVSFSLDDFGTGYSSLAYLKKMPIEQLKIDQSFVRDILIDHNDSVIAKTVTALARSMGLTVIAEGVETREHRDLLAEMGCPAYQGYLFGHPMPLKQFERSLGAGNTSPGAPNSVAAST